MGNFCTTGIDTKSTQNLPDTELQINTFLSHNLMIESGSSSDDEYMNKINLSDQVETGIFIRCNNVELILYIHKSQQNQRVLTVLNHNLKKIKTIRYNLNQIQPRFSNWSYSRIHRPRIFYSQKYSLCLIFERGSGSLFTIDIKNSKVLKRKFKKETLDADFVEEDSLLIVVRFNQIQIIDPVTNKVRNETKVGLTMTQGPFYVNYIKERKTIVTAGNEVHILSYQLGKPLEVIHKIATPGYDAITIDSWGTYLAIICFSSENLDSIYISLYCLKQEKTEFIGGRNEVASCLYDISVIPCSKELLVYRKRQGYIIGDQYRIDVEKKAVSNLGKSYPYQIRISDPDMVKMIVSTDTKYFLVRLR